MGLKTIDTFEELNLNPDLLRGIYGINSLTQLSVLKSHPLFNKKEFSQLSAKKTLSLKHNQEQAKLLPFPLEFSNFLILSHQNVKPLFLLPPENLHNKSTKSSFVFLNSSTSTLVAVLEELTHVRTEKLLRMEVFKLLSEPQEE